MRFKSWALLAVFIVLAVLVSGSVYNKATRSATAVHSDSGTPESEAAAPEAAKTADGSTNLYRTSYNMRGMMSVKGADKLERVLKESPGVVNARVSFFTNETWVVYRQDVTSSSDIERSINQVSDKWPYASASLVAQKAADNSDLPAWKTTPKKLVTALRKKLIPKEGSQTPAGFTLSLSQAADFIAYNDETRDLPADQQAIIKEALDFVIVCCPPFKAWPG
ncbi:hypothetical protein [Terrihalobacillus insolitus]|uniref:hypothetical protein n=1 Tax=Terrihalobacillus insolitus TaxID=2950438 RepID=UPI0023411A8C|nr:hypothetical protein [Terrihalobacillus insolitus]MDC3412937.1 hypothetical protein [Terrihalobacillus insolitus]